MRIRIWSNIRHAVSKSGHFTHDKTFFHHDVREKRFNTHMELHCMEMTIIKNHVAEKPRRGLDLWRHGRPWPCEWVAGDSLTG